MNNKVSGRGSTVTAPYPPLRQSTKPCVLSGLVFGLRMVHPNVQALRRPSLRMHKKVHKFVLFNPLSPSAFSQCKKITINVIRNIKKRRKSGNLQIFHNTAVISHNLVLCDRVSKVTVPGPPLRHRKSWVQIEAITP